jgi:hypothetical protein
MTIRTSVLLHNWINLFFGAHKLCLKPRHVTVTSLLFILEDTAFSFCYVSFLYLLDISIPFTLFSTVIINRPVLRLYHVLIASV